MSVYKRGGSWLCDITIDGWRVQRVLKKARTRAQAIKAKSVMVKANFRLLLNLVLVFKELVLPRSSKTISCLTQNYISGRTQTTF